MLTSRARKQYIHMKTRTRTHTHTHTHTRTHKRESTHTMKVRGQHNEDAVTNAIYDGLAECGAFDEPEHLAEVAPNPLSCFCD